MSKQNMVDAIADCLVQDHIDLMAENKRLRDALNQCADMVAAMSYAYVLAATAAAAIRALLHNERIEAAAHDSEAEYARQLFRPAMFLLAKIENGKFSSDISSGVTKLCNAYFGEVRPE